ncbi:hypothetical protein PRIPAC_71914 [Pristionchus pacificus]|uniref:Uncharacterized protein n=1 Tax=Pristionchus pacificus TaxID=54126 RepID=A0A2A6C684_PRIPA|nr:hypothetical protein PRIPAC_71914 [Pristionchus pacificus]|eukprot:PDM73674.1 hypothetical protein PRIPAC_41030 [Pristionchus pacificus]
MTDKRPMTLQGVTSEHNREIRTSLSRHLAAALGAAQGGRRNDHVDDVEDESAACEPERVALGERFKLLTDPIDAVEDGVECDCDGEKDDSEQSEDGEWMENRYYVQNLGFFVARGGEVIAVVVRGERVNAPIVSQNIAPVQNDDKLVRDDDLNINVPSFDDDIEDIDAPTSTASTATKTKITRPARNTANTSPRPARAMKKPRF